MEVVEIDRVGPQARQAVVARAPQRLGTSVDRPRAGLVPEDPALAREDDVRAVRLEDGSDEILVGAETIDLALI